MSRRIFFFILPSLLIFNSFHVHSSFTDYSDVIREQLFKTWSGSLYKSIDFESDPVSYEVFEYGMKGFLAYQLNQKESPGKILTLIDFSRPSTKKRLWVIDLNRGEVLYHLLVAHGRNSGENTASHFSNIPQSYQSSLGFYLTGSTYMGKHGLSLILEGKEKGFNDKARERAIVMHGADYVSRDFINRYGRLGRSFGCPSISMDVYKEVIPVIAEGTGLFIYYPNTEYLQKSVVINSIPDWYEEL